MERRDVLKTAGLILGYTLTGGTALAVMKGCSADPVTGWTPSFLDQNEIEIVKSAANVVVPSINGKPGAKDVMIEKFFDERIDLYATEEEKAEIKLLFKDFSQKIKESEGKDFTKLSEEEQFNIVKSSLEGDDKFMKELHLLAITGFCTSERGMKEVLVFDPIPGEQKGCIPFEEVGGIWAI